MQGMMDGVGAEAVGTLQNNQGSVCGEERGVQILQQMS